jgi:hypothetical protein
LHNNSAKGKTELEADLEAEALPEALTFCWKQMRWKRKFWKQKRKQLWWKRNQKR